MAQHQHQQQRPNKRARSNDTVLNSADDGTPPLPAPLVRMLVRASPAMLAQLEPRPGSANLTFAYVPASHETDDYADAGVVALLATGTRDALLPVHAAIVARFEDCDYSSARTVHNNHAILRPLMHVVNEDFFVGETPEASAHDDVAMIALLKAAPGIAWDWCATRQELVDEVPELEMQIPYV